MKKRIILFTIITLILAIICTGIWLIINRSKPKQLYKVSCEFTNTEVSSELVSKITTAQDLYSIISTSDNRIPVLKNIIIKLDSFEKDLNSSMVLISSKKNSKSANELSKSYSNLIKSRKQLLKIYDEYITRMSGNINADAVPAPLQNLYNELFGKTIDYLYEYNNCFKDSSKFVFEKVYKIDTIKLEVYSLYSLAVDNLLNTITNNRFSNTTLITKLNSGINVNNGILQLSPSIVGGEFSLQALKFKHHFNNSNKNNLIINFNSYYSQSINPATETSSEKLAVYYAKLILGL